MTRLVCGIVGILLLASCSSKSQETSSGGGAAAAPAGAQQTVHCTKNQQTDEATVTDYDPSVRIAQSIPAEDQNLLVSDLIALQTASDKALSEDSVGYKIFGKNLSSGTEDFICERIHFVTPYESEVDFSFKYLEGVQTGAVNVSLGIWMTKLLNPRRDVSFVFNTNETVPVKSSRVGVIQLGPGYNKRAGFIQRMSILVHEARHSDCPKGVWKSDLETARKGGNELKNMTCGHGHIVCPEGHDYAGHEACDSIAWGAYSMGAIYASTAAATCENCERAEIERAKVISADSFYRLIEIDTKKMLEGGYGEPDLTNSKDLLDL